jgi:hypothetical protein
MKRIIIFMLVMSVSLAMAVGQHRPQRLRLTGGNWGEFSPSVVITPHPGWPRSLPSDIWWPGPCRVVVADLDGDKKEELMILVQREESGFFILNEDGTIRMEYIIPLPLYESFSVADLDNDGKQEIVLLIRKHPFKLSLAILNGAGNIMIQKEMSDYLYRVIPPVIADIEGDGKLEIILKESIPGDINVIVLDNKGEITAGWPFHRVENVGSTVECYHIVGNFDDDRDLEIVVPVWYYDGNDNWFTFIKIYNRDGTILPGWGNFSIPDLIYTPVSVDINQDGYDEIICNDFSGYMHILNRNGQVLFNKNYDKTYGTPAVGDLNNDGILEIVFTTYGGGDSLMAVDMAGNELFKVELFSPTRFSPVIGDIDGDRFPDVVVASLWDVNAVNYRGEMIAGFPLEITKSDRAPSPTITDLDNDGKIEIVASTDSMDSLEDPIIYVWDLDTPYDPLNMPWPMYQHDVGHSGRYVERSHILPPSDITLLRQINRSLFRKEAYHTFTWAANPRNRKQYDIAEYRIYRRKDEEGDDQYRLLTALPVDTFTYEDGPLDYTRKYVYVFTSVDVNGDEGLRSVPLSHEVPYGASR